MTVIVMGGFTGKVVPKLGERRAIIIGFLLMTVGFLGYALAPHGLDDLCRDRHRFAGRHREPRVQSVMSQQAGPSAQGELQGAVASISSIAAVLSPLFMTRLFSTTPGPTHRCSFRARRTWSPGCWCCCACSSAPAPCTRQRCLAGKRPEACCRRRPTASPRASRMCRGRKWVLL